MKSKIGVLVVIVALSSISGCFIEGGEGGSLEFDGSMNISDSEFSMDGHIAYEGGTLTKETYRDVAVELYRQNGTHLHSEHIGDITEPAAEYNVSFTYQKIPYYIIIDSPDIWDGRSTIRYYYRYSNGGPDYGVEAITDKSGLPVTPDG